MKNSGDVIITTSRQGLDKAGREKKEGKPNREEEKKGKYREEGGGIHLTLMEREHTLKVQPMHVCEWNSR